MVDKQQGPENGDAGAESVESDPTFDIVRQMIKASEAVPAPAHKPAGPTTPRPEAAPSVPEPSPLPVPDADPDIWDDADEAEAWDDPYAAPAGPGYRIVDVDTGVAVDPDGVFDAYDPAATGEAHAAAPVPESRLRRMLRRLRQALGAWIRARLAAASAQVAAFLRRPDAPRRLAVALLVIFVIAWPWKVLLLTLLIPLAGLITWASVGSDGCVELVEKWYERLRARDPAKAERIRLRAAAVTRTLNHGLERLPESWTRALYLPDFETDGYVPEKLKVDPFEELAVKVHSAKRTGEGA